MYSSDWDGAASCAMQLPLPQLEPKSFVSETFTKSTDRSGLGEGYCSIKSTQDYTPPIFEELEDANCVYRRLVANYHI